MSNSRTSKIEAEIAKILNFVKGQQVTPEYKYFTVTGTVDIYDERLSLSTNENDGDPATDAKSVNHIIQQDEDEGISGGDFSTGQGVYTNTVVYEIRSKVHNIGDASSADSHPKNEIKEKLSELFDDLLHVFAYGHNYHLNGQANEVKFLNAYREFADITNNRIQTAVLVTRWQIQFNQSYTNPTVPACW